MPDRARIKALLDFSGSPRTTGDWTEGMWRRGSRETKAFANGRAVMFTLTCSPIAGIVGANAIWTDSWLLRSLFGAATGLLGGLVAIGLLWVVLSFRAVWRQRDEARAHLRDAGDLRRLLLLRDHLHATSQTNRRWMDDLVNRGLTGPVGEFEDPWIREQNRQTKSQLDYLGYPELAPQLVFGDSELLVDTWENVLLTAKRIDRKAADFMSERLSGHLQFLEE